MSSASPHAQFSPSTSHHSGPRVKSEHGDDGKGKPKIFVCDKCGKRYARRDYLERHALNHEERSYKCNACGKGFARIDVLKKHETVACKMLRHGDGPGAGAGPGPSSSRGPAAPQSLGAGYAQPQPRIKESQQRSRAGSPVIDETTRKRQKREESVASSSTSASTGEENEDQVEPEPPYDRRFSMPGPSHHILPHPAGGGMYDLPPPSSAHRYSHSQSHAISSTPIHPHPHLPPIHTAPPTTNAYPMISPTQPKDMSISLAPAYAPTPDVTDLPSDTAPLKSETESRSIPIHPTSALEPPTATHPDVTETTGWEGGGGPGNAGDFGMPAKVGENMDDLLSWLFNTNAPGTGGDWALGIQGGQMQQDMQSHQFLPSFVTDPTNNQGGTVPVDTFNYPPMDAQDGPPGYSQQQHQPPASSHQHSQAQQWLPGQHFTQGGGADSVGMEGGPSALRSNFVDPTQSGPGNIQSGSLTTHRRYPQAFHPLYVPNIPGKTSIPNFSGSEKILVQGREKYKEVIDEDTRDAMLAMFEGPGKRELMSPAFSLQRMRLYLELYFMHFAPLYPIIHQPSLRFRRLPPDLLLALICIGTAFADDKEGLRIASKLHKRLRNRIFEMVEDEPKASVHNLQTLLLINHFSRSYCSLKEHDISQIFHSPSVYMIRLAGTLLPKFTRQSAVSDDPVTCWLDWVCEEERKRLGWFAFMMDLENAALYRHFLMIHCYFMEIPFPTSSSSWTAPDPFSWSTALRESLSVPTPSFRNALRELAGRGTVPPNLNDQSLWILIHGLINVSWTLLWRDLGELSMVHENKITGWKDSLRRAFKTWVGHVEGRAAVCEEALYTVGIPFAQLGSVLLLSDTEEIRIFAGASNIAGRSISPGEWTAANTYVHAWARSQDGAYACYTAVELLSQVYKWSAEDRWATAPAFIPWCTYVSSLIIWAYSTVLDGPDSLQAPYIIPMTNNPDRPLEHGQTSEIRIEPSLARRAAQSYLANMLRRTQGEAFALPDVQGKNACAGVLAYTAYLMGIGGRGVLDEARRVLLGLLGEG